MSIYTKEEQDFLVKIGQVKKGEATAAPSTEVTKDEVK
jgi:hypothetical protein